MSSKDAHLYGQRPKHRSEAKNTSLSSSLNFSASLSSLISASASTSTSKTTGGRARPKKDDIFKTHNKNVKKRAAKDLEDDGPLAQKHKGRTDAEMASDEATWKRTQRKLEEKARLYNALKRGDLEDKDDKYGVDFDRKWAEKHDKGLPESDNEESENSDSDSGNEGEPLYDYVDEFGRTKKLTRAQIAREERMKRMGAADEPDRFTARPKAPERVLYGDTIQAGAFNPDEATAQAMAEIAAKRDRTPTPPPPEHFDGRKEMRQKGTGFFAFSTDEEERVQQMRRLDAERERTERLREENKRKMQEKKLRMEERKKGALEKKRDAQSKRAAAQADQFLEELGNELFGG